MIFEWDEQPGWLAVRDYELRWILTRPRAHGRRPALLFLPGFGGRSLAFSLAEANPRDGYASLLRYFADAGFVTARVEHSGVGESGGPPYATADLGSELDGYRAALVELSKADFVEPSSIFLFGHSLGGVLAPILAAESSLAGVIVYGTPSRPWSECLASGARRQLALGGLDASRLEIESELASRLYSKLLREGYDRERLARDEPDLLGGLAAGDLRGASLHGRSLDYLREIERIDLEAAWKRVRSPVLALQGELDWIVDDGDHDRIASFCAAGVDATARALPGVDHDFQRHPSLVSSFRRRGRGEPDSSAAEAGVAWMRRRLPA